MQYEYTDPKKKSEHLLEKQIDPIANRNSLNNQFRNNFNNQESNFLIPNAEKKEEVSPQKNQEGEEDHVNFNLYFFIRSFLVVTMIALISLNTVYGYALPHGNVQCLEDRVFIATESLNKFFHHNASFRNFLIIVSSFCVDFSVIYMCVIWCLWGKSWRIFGALFCFYMLRGIVQSIFQMSYPEGFIWEYPGFPSIMVSYLKTNDFFYSGHVGLPVLLMCEFKILKRNYMFVFCILTLFIEAFTMVATRGHYTIDLITGVIFAHYIFQNVERNIHYIDRLTFTKLENENHEGNLFNNNCNEQYIYPQQGQRQQQSSENLNSEFSPVPIKNEV